MKTASLVTFAAALLLVSVGCAAFRRKEAVPEYLERSGDLVAGMTRAELYAKAPPTGTPKAMPPRLSWVISVAQYTFHHEVHRLKDGRAIYVLYRLKDITEYPQSALHPKNRHKSLEMSMDLARGAELDRLNKRTVDSAQNPADVVYRVTRFYEAPDPEARPGAADLPDANLFPFSGWSDEVLLEQ